MTAIFFSRIINQLKMKRTLLQRRLSTRQYKNALPRSFTFKWALGTSYMSTWRIPASPLEKRNFSLYFGFLCGKKAYNSLSVPEITKVDCLTSTTNLWDLISPILCSKASWQNANLSILQLQA